MFSVNFDAYDDDNKPIDPTRYRSIKKSILVTQSQSVASANERKQAANIQFLNAQKRLKLIEQRKARLKAAQPSTTLVNNQPAPVSSQQQPNTNNNINASRYQRIKSAKSDRVSMPSSTQLPMPLPPPPPPPQPSTQQPHQSSLTQPDNSQLQQPTQSADDSPPRQLNDDPHLQPDYINKQNNLILNKIKHYSKNTEIEDIETLKLKRDFTTNYFDTIRVKEKNR